MGIFNVINSKLKCPKCHETVEWQSKYLTYDGYVLENLLEAITLNKHMDGEMHAFCDNCETAVDVDINIGASRGAAKTPTVVAAKIRKNCLLVNSVFSGIRQF